MSVLKEWYEEHQIIKGPQISTKMGWTSFEYIYGDYCKYCWDTLVVPQNVINFVFSLDALGYIVEESL